MGYALFFGCMFIAFGPAIAIFYFNISKNPQLIILTIGSSFFWLISILLASVWWYIIPPLQDFLFWTILWSVFFQETGRLLFFKVYSLAQKGVISSNVQQTSHLMSHPDSFATSIAFGIGTGVTYCCVMYLSVLWEATGPGTYFSPSCPSISIFILSAVLSFCFILFHVFWSIFSFDGFRQKSYWKLLAVFLCHLSASSLTMLNIQGGSCVASLILIFLLLIVSAIATWFVMINRNFLGRSTVNSFSKTANIEMTERPSFS